ncbi:MAG: hypothetical protein QNK37_38950 [Acidobacteriota bacterium]|nr:hypothetical protein [Acidobacteriota bacterium]
MICLQEPEFLEMTAANPGHRHDHETEPGNEEPKPEDDPPPFAPPQPGEDTPDNDS